MLHTHQKHHPDIHICRVIVKCPHVVDLIRLDVVDVNPTEVGAVGIFDIAQKQSWKVKNCRPNAYHMNAADELNVKVAVQCTGDHLINKESL